VLKRAVNARLHALRSHKRGKSGGLLHKMFQGIFRPVGKALASEFVPELRQRGIAVYSRKTQAVRR